MSERGECEVCHSEPATITALVTPPDGTLEVGEGCMESIGKSEGWVDYDYYVAQQDRY